MNVTMLHMPHLATSASEYVTLATVVVGLITI